MLVITEITCGYKLQLRNQCTGQVSFGRSVDHATYAELTGSATRWDGRNRIHHSQQYDRTLQSRVISGTHAKTCCETLRANATLRRMPLILILVILLLVFGGGGYYMGPGVGYYGGGGLSLIVILVILYLVFGRGRSL